MKQAVDSLKVLSYELVDGNRYDNGVALVMIKGLSLYGEKEVDRWAISWGSGGVLCKKPFDDGNYYFVLQPSPSNRDDEFISDHRFDTAMEAYTFWLAHKDNMPQLQNELSRYNQWLQETGEKNG